MSGGRSAQHEGVRSIGWLCLTCRFSSNFLNVIDDRIGHFDDCPRVDLIHYYVIVGDLVSMDSVEAADQISHCLLLGVVECDGNFSALSKYLIY